MRYKDPFDVHDVTLFVVTDKAIQIGPKDSDDDDEKQWIPKSQILGSDIDYDAEDALYSHGYVTIPYWLAKEKGFAD